MTGPRPIGLTPAEQEKQRTAEYWRKFDATMAERRAQEIDAGIEHGGPIPDVAPAPDSALLSAPDAAHQRVTAEQDKVQQAAEQQAALVDHALAARDATSVGRRPTDAALPENVPAVAGLLQKQPYTGTAPSGDPGLTGADLEMAQLQREQAKREKVTDQATHDFIAGGGTSGHGGAYYGPPKAMSAFQRQRQSEDERIALEHEIDVQAAAMADAASKRSADIRSRRPRAPGQ